MNREMFHQAHMLLMQAARTWCKSLDSNMEKPYKPENEKENEKTSNKGGHLFQVGQIKEYVDNDNQDCLA